MTLMKAGAVGPETAGGMGRLQTLHAQIYARSWPQSGLFSVLFPPLHCWSDTHGKLLRTSMGSPQTLRRYPIERGHGEAT